MYRCVEERFILSSFFFFFCSEFCLINLSLLENICAEILNLLF